MQFSVSEFVYFNLLVSNLALFCTFGKKYFETVVLHQHQLLLKLPYHGKYQNWHIDLVVCSNTSANFLVCYFVVVAGRYLVE